MCFHCFLAVEEHSHLNLKDPSDANQRTSLGLVGEAVLDAVVECQD